ncbi:hypothetical protein [Streptomyces luteireticuli]|uniref:hypothetical protein n=1 Tax=Streptomyces luteireticuli TaxID=173858 RepID=UPI003558395C
MNPEARKPGGRDVVGAGAVVARMTVGPLARSMRRTTVGTVVVAGQEEQRTAG